jgi:hypothetical protein
MLLTLFACFRRRRPTPPPGAAWIEAERLRAEREQAQAIRAHQSRLWS